MEVQGGLRHYVMLLLHWSWLIVLAAVVSGALAYILSTRQESIFESSTTLLIEEGSAATGNTNYQSVLTSQQRARTYAELLTVTPLLDAVIQRLGLNLSADALRETIVTESVRDTQLIRVRVRDTDPHRAADTANTLVTLFAEERASRQSSRYAASKESLQTQMSVLNARIAQAEDDLATSDNTAERDRLIASLSTDRQNFANLLQSYEQVRIAEAESISSVFQEDPAKRGRQIAPRIVPNTALGVFVGLVLALGAVLLTEELDDTVRNPEHLSTHLGLAILGIVPRMRYSGPEPIVASQPRSPVAEAFRSIRTNIEFASVDHHVKTLLISSPVPADGKSTICVNLGIVLAQARRPTILLDADMRRPTLHQYFGLESKRGLSDLFRLPGISPDTVLQTTSSEEVGLISTGILPPNPAELLASHKMTEILDDIGKYTDIVIIDSPPVNAVTDAVVLSSKVDGVLLVVRVGKTSMSACKHAVSQLRLGGAPLLGLIINDVPAGRSQYGYTYSKYYQEDRRNRGVLAVWPFRNLRSMGKRSKNTSAKEL